MQHSFKGIREGYLVAKIEGKEFSVYEYTDANFKCVFNIDFNEHDFITLKSHNVLIKLHVQKSNTFASIIRWSSNPFQVLYTSIEILDKFDNQQILTDIINTEPIQIQNFKVIHKTIRDGLINFF